jgi:LPXTG-site transpeptidase (sortase) family protein
MGLVSWGSWIFYQNYLEASKPPPAPIVEVSLEDFETPTAQSSPTPVVPTEVSPTETLEPRAESRSTAAVPDDDTPTPPPEPTATPPAEATPTPELSLRQEIASIIEAKIVEEITLSQALEQTPEATGDEVLSLEDNPLLVEQATPLPEAAAAEQPPVAEAPAGSLTRIVAESIQLDAPVIEVGWKQVVQNGVPVNVWTVADYAAGWHTNSMLPGQGGNIVLSGHHNIKGEVFRYIVDLEPGAVVSLYIGDQRYDYVVDDKFIVKDKGEPQEVRIANARWIGSFNEERLTMVTCWPYNNNTHRVIVIAKPL